MFRKICTPPPDRFPPHLQEEPGRINLDRTHHSTQSTEATFEGYFLILFPEGIVPVSNVLWFPVFPQEGALLLTQIALDAGT